MPISVELTYLLEAIVNIFKGIVRLVWVKPETPTTLLNEYVSLQMKIEQELNNMIPVDQFQQLHNPPARILRKIEYLKYKADRLWKAKDIPNQYRSAYLYAIIGYVYDHLMNCSEAGRYYHYAAHKFRDLNEFSIAGKFYKWSGDCLRQNNPFFALRSYERGRKCFEEVGEEFIANMIKKIENEIIEQHNINLEMFINGWWNQRGHL